MIRCRFCGFEMALNLGMAWEEQMEKGCPACQRTEADWFTGWPVDNGPWSAGDWRTRFEEQRAAFTAARQAAE